MTRKEFKSVSDYIGKQVTYTQTFLNGNDGTEKRVGIIRGSTKEGSICIKDKETGKDVFAYYECVEL